MEARASGHVPGIDGLRGIAIAAVLVFHFAGDALRGNASGYSLVSWGWIGVELFFVLSGFLITDILVRARGAAHYFRNFWGRRLLRIAPAYFAMLAIVLFVLPVDVGLVRDRQAWLWTFSSNVWTWLHGEWGFATTAVDLNHTWSLAIEEQFYLAWPFVIWLVPRHALPRLLVCGIVLTAGVRTVLVLREYDELVAYTFTPARLDGLLLGSLIAAARHQRHCFDANRWRWLGLTACLVLIATFAWRGSDHADPFVSTVGITVIACAAATAVISALSGSNMPTLHAVLSSRVLRTLGKYSYGLYLVHGLLRPWVHERWPEPLDALAFGSALSLALAVASYHLLEAPFLRAKDRYFARASS